MKLVQFSVHYIACEEGKRASGGGSATSVAACCSKTGPLRMRVFSSLVATLFPPRERCWCLRRRGGWGVPPNPNSQLALRSTLLTARQSRESLQRVEVSPRAPRAFSPLSFSLSPVS